MLGCTAYEINLIGQHTNKWFLLLNREKAIGGICMQQINNKLVVKKAIAFSLFMTIMMSFIVENPMPNTAIYLLVVGVVSFIGFCIIQFITSKAYNKFLKDTTDF